MSASAEHETLFQEQDRARRLQYAGLLVRTLVIACAIQTLLLLVGWILSPHSYQVLIGVGLFSLLLVASLLYPLWQRRGRDMQGIYTVLGSFALAIAGGYFLVPALGLAAVAASVVVIINTLQLLGRKEGRPVIAVVLLTLFGNILFHQWVTLPLPELNREAAIFCSTGIAIVSILGALISIIRLVKRQEELFFQSWRAGREVEERAAAEQALRERLQAATQRYAESMAKVAGGDLAVRVVLDEREAPANDPLAMLGQYLNDTIASLQAMIGRIHETARTLSTASSEIMATTAQHAAGMAEQSAAVTQASSTIDELRAIADQTARSAESVADMARRTAEVSQAGRQAVEAAVAGMMAVREKVETITATIRSLEERARAIGQIIATVGEIAAQSNLLALNAAVEAARAGAAGKGFGVVADEMRTLAEQSRAATDQVRGLLSEIEQGVRTAVVATEDGKRGADSGAELASLAGESIRELAKSVDESVQAAIQIASAARQQLGGIEQILLAMQNIHQVTVQTAAGTQQVERAVGELNRMANELREVVEQYRI